MEFLLLLLIIQKSFGPQALALFSIFLFLLFILFRFILRSFHRIDEEYKALDERVWELVNKNFSLGAANQLEKSRFRTRIIPIFPPKPQEKKENPPEETKQS